MNDRLSPGGQQAMTGEQQGIDRPPTVTVAEAAARLGLSADAIRGRLQRGTLPGVKVEGIWRVTLPDDVPPPTGIRESQQATTGQQQATTGDRQAIDGAPTGHRLLAHLHHLEGEVEYLREQLAGALGQLAEERRRADVLRLSASVSDPPNDNDSTIEDAGQDRATGILERLRQWIRGSG